MYKIHIHKPKWVICFTSLFLSSWKNNCSISWISCRVVGSWGGGAFIEYLLYSRFYLDHSFLFVSLSFPVSLSLGFSLCVSEYVSLFLTHTKLYVPHLCSLLGNIHFWYWTLCLLSSSLCLLSQAPAAVPDTIVPGCQKAVFLLL